MKSQYIGIVIAASALVLSSCSSDSDDDSASSASDALIIGDSASGTSADNIATNDLRSNAARLAADSLGMNINDVLGITVPTDNTVSTTVGDNVDNAELLDDNIYSLMMSSVALDSTQAEVSRAGNIVTIDPDEIAICQEEVLGSMSLPEDIDICATVLRDLLVVLDAKTDDTGVLTYEFQQKPVLSIGYSPNGGSYELDLDGIKAFLAAAAEADPDATLQLPETMTGALRAVATIENESGIDAAGELSLLVTKPISIIDNEAQVNVSLDNSELFGISSDNNGNTKITANYGALGASFPIEQDTEDPTAATDIISLVMQGFTSNLDLDSNNEEVKLSNSGSSLSVSVNSGEAIRLSVSNYGMTISSDSISIDPGLTLGATLTNVAGELTDGLFGNSAQLDVAFEDGTELVPAANGTTKISSGGLSYQALINTNEGAVSSSFSARAGDCIDSNSADSSDEPPAEGSDQLDSDVPLLIVGCGDQ